MPATLSFHLFGSGGVVLTDSTCLWYRPREIPHSLRVSVADSWSPSISALISASLELSSLLLSSQISIKSPPSHENPPQGASHTSDEASILRLSRPSDPHGRNSAIQFESPLSLAIGPLSFSDRETEDRDDGSGTFPHDVKSDIVSSHSEMPSMGVGSTNLQLIPIPAKERGSKPDGASESAMTSFMAAGLHFLSQTDMFLRPRKGSEASLNRSPKP